MKLFNISKAENYIKDYCKDSKEINPVKMAQELMKTEFVRMHGPEHHFLTSAVLASAYCNAAGIDKVDILDKLQVRCHKIPPAVCGFYGVCGDVMAAGAFISVITNATYMSKEEWQMNAIMTSRCIAEIAKSKGPRCCKRTTFTVLMTAVEVIRELFKVQLEKPQEYVCKFKEQNTDCIGEECLFYQC